MTTISSMSVNPCCLSISAPYAKWRYFVSGKEQKREAKREREGGFREFIQCCREEQRICERAEIPSPERENALFEAH
jgi:hypothetical protein